MTILLDDGAVKIWKNYTNEHDLKLTTAFQIIQDLLPSTRGSRKNIFFYKCCHYFALRLK